MPATAAEYKMELTDDLDAFFDRTGIMLSGEELNWLGLKSNDCEAIFRECEVHMIQEFCKKNVEYHIMTMTDPGHIEYRYVSGRRVYYLAKGDKNPNLALNPLVGPNAALFTERVIETALTIIADINRSGNTK